MINIQMIYINEILKWIIVNTYHETTVKPENYTIFPGKMTLKYYYGK